MAKSSRRDKVQAATALQSRSEVEDALIAIHRHRATIASAHATLDTHVAELTDRTRRLAAPLQEEIARLQERIHLFCAANRAELTNGNKKKTVKFENGTVTWRKGRARVILDLEEADVITSIKAMKLTQFLRVIEQVDKPEMLLNPAAARTIPGVRIEDTVETFAVENLTE